MNGETDGGLNPGRAAEERVADLYRAMGFSAQCDVRIGGKQWDVIAERPVSGFDSFTLFVEVKDHPGKSTPIDEIRQFAAAASLALSKQSCNGAVLVTTGTITKDSWEVVEGIANLRLLTYSELERQLFQPAPALARWLHAYRQTPINQVFIDLQATLVEHDLGPQVKLPSKVNATALIDVALQHPDAALIVFADYGSGKTTSLERIYAEAIDRHRVDETAVVPLLIRLRDLAVDTDVEQAALTTVRRDLGVDITADGFWKLVAGGRLLFLLDGFDEITLRADRGQRGKLLGILSPLLFGQSPAILTSRPSYFATRAEYKVFLKQIGKGILSAGSPTDAATSRVDRFVATALDRYVTGVPPRGRDANFITFQLDPLSSDQIDEFLQLNRDALALHSTTPGVVRGFLNGIYDLSELISRPIILDMAVLAITHGQIDPAKGTLANGPAGLYEAYSKLQLGRDWEQVESRRQLLSAKDRLLFAQECAVEMLKTDELKIPAENIAGVASRVLMKVDGVISEEFLTDLRTCSFLTVDADGALEFIHRSYQEFFLAQRLRAELLVRDLARLRGELRWEFLYFLGAYAFTDNKFYEILLEISRAGATRQTPEATAADNAAVAVLAARESATDLRWKHRQVRNLQRQRLSISRSTLTDVSALGWDVQDFSISDSAIEMVVAGAPVESLRIVRCEGSVELHGRVGTAAFDGGKLKVHIQAVPGSVTAESMELDLRIEGGSALVKVTKTTGAVVVDDGRVNNPSMELNASECELWVDPAGGRVCGVIDRSLVMLPSAAVLTLDAKLGGSTLLVQPFELPAGRPHPPALHTDPSQSSLVLVSPSVALPGWWSAVGSLITVGADQVAAEVPIVGLTVRSTSLPGKKEDDWVHLRSLGPRSVVLEGRGSRLDAAIGALGALIGEATLPKLRTSRWLIGRLHGFVNGMDGADAVDELLEEITAHQDALARHLPG